METDTSEGIPAKTSSSQPVNPFNLMPRTLGNVFRRYSFSNTNATPAEPSSMHGQASPASSGNHSATYQPPASPSVHRTPRSSHRSATFSFSPRAQKHEDSCNPANDRISAPASESRSGSDSLDLALTEAASTRRVKKIRLTPIIDSTRPLMFFPAELELLEGGPAVQIGRYSEKCLELDADNASELPYNGADSVSSKATAVKQVMKKPVIIGRHKTYIAFQSKVVSRQHAELWCDLSGRLFLRDTKSSSGTFVNRTRLSPPGVFSRPYELKEGDWIQFGIDFQGGTQDYYRAIKVRFESNDKLDVRPTEYGNNVLRKLQRESPPKTSSTSKSDAPRHNNPGLSECCICLLKIRVSQALFIAPCSHMFHFKCIRPMIMLHHPGFSCPLCRSFHDMDADPQDDTDEENHLPQPNPNSKIVTGNFPRPSKLLPLPPDVRVSEVRESLETNADVTTIELNDMASSISDQSNNVLDDMHDNAFSTPLLEPRTLGQNDSAEGSSV